MSDPTMDLLLEISRKQDITNEKLAKMEVHVEENANDLKEHMRRTELLEEKVDLQKQEINARFQKIEAPGKIRKLLFNKFTKIITWLGTISGALYAIVRFWPTIEQFIK